MRERSRVDCLRNYNLRKQLLGAADRVREDRLGRPDTHQQHLAAENSQEVEQTNQRSGWPASRILATFGIARRRDYCWLKEEAWATVGSARKGLT
jgi:hypothetical protein